MFVFVPYLCGNLLSLSYQSCFRSFFLEKITMLRHLNCVDHKMNYVFKQVCVAPWSLLCALLATQWWWKLWWVSWILSLFLLAQYLLHEWMFLYAVVLLQSREHANCGHQPGFVRAHIESTFHYMPFELHLGLCNLFLMNVSHNYHLLFIKKINFRWWI